MPVYRTPDGKIVEKNTGTEKKSDKTDFASPPNTLQNQRAAQGVNTGANKENIKENDREDFFDKATVKIQDSTEPLDQSLNQSLDSSSEQKTRLIRARKNSELGVEKSADNQNNSDFMADPIVGWLVIIDGPGAGTFNRLGYGTNSIGRDAEQRVSLDYGDELISRENHAALTYDARGRKFYLQHGGGTNLTYINDEPVLQATQIEDKTIIQLGETTLCFVAFCGKTFDWQDSTQDK